MRTHILSQTPNLKKIFTRMVIDKFSKQFGETVGMNSILPNVKKIRTDEILGIMTTKGFLPSNTNSVVFPHKTSMELISNRWDILQLFNISNPMPNNYINFTGAFFNEISVAIKDVDNSISIGDISEKASLSIKEFYDILDNHILQDSFRKNHVKNSYKLSKIVPSISINDSIKEIEYMPYYAITFKEEVTDIIDSSKVIASQAVPIFIDSNKRLFSFVTLLFFPTLEKIIGMIFDSENILSIKAYKLMDSVSKDFLIHKLAKELIAEYYNSIVEFSTNINKVVDLIKSADNISPIVKSPLISILSTDINNIPKLQNTQIQPTSSKQSIFITFGNMFNYLAYEYLDENNKKYLFTFDSNGENLSLVNKPSDLKDLKLFYLSTSDDLNKRTIAQIYDTKQTTLKNFHKILNDTYYSKMTEYNLFKKIESAIDVKYSTLVESIDNYYNFNSYDEALLWPIIGFDLKFYKSGYSVNLTLFYNDSDSDNFDIPIFRKYICRNIIKYSVYGNNRVIVTTRKPSDSCIKTFVNILKYNLAKNNIKGKRSIYTKDSKVLELCNYFLNSFIKEFNDIKKIKRMLLYVGKSYMNNILNDNDIISIEKQNRSYNSILNSYKNGCSYLTDLNKNICSGITYKSSDNLSNFISELCFYCNWNYESRGVNIEGCSL